MGFENIVLLSVVEIFGDFNLRWYAQSNQFSYLVSGIVGYIGVIYYLVKSLRVDNVLYVALGDRLGKPIQYVGLVMIIAGTYLLKHDGK